GAEARSGAGAASHATDDRAPALFADPADGGRRAARDFSVRRVQPAGGADQSVSGFTRAARARPSGAARRHHTDRRARVQRLDAAVDPDVSGSLSIPRVRDAGRRAVRWRTGSSALYRVIHRRASFPRAARDGPRRLLTTMETSTARAIHDPAAD